MISVSLLGPDVLDIGRTIYYDNLINLVRSHPWYIEEGGDLLIPIVDTAQETNWPRYNNQQSAYIRGCMPSLQQDCSLINYLEQIISWSKENVAQKILLINMHPFFRLPIILSECPNIIVADGSLAHHERQINSRTISMPALPMVNNVARMSQDRTILASFRGSLSHPVRKKLAELHNNTDIIIQLGSWGKESKVDATQYKTDSRYESLLDSSIFSFVPRGDALFSYRLLEVMARGSIPIILSDGWVLPFDRAIEWDKFSLRFHSDAIGLIPGILRRISSQRISEMQTEATQTYREKLQTMEAIVNTLMHEVVGIIETSICSITNHANIVPLYGVKIVSEQLNLISKPRPKLFSSVTQAQEAYNEALALHQKGQLSQAQMICEEILKSLPKFCDALHLLGVIAYQTKNYQHAVDLLEKAIEILPNNATYYSNRGIVLQDFTQLDAAMACYDKVILLKPDCAVTYYNRGITLQKLGHLHSAIVSYDNAILHKPDYFEAYYNRGNSLKALHQLDAALFSFNIAILFKPDYTEAYNNRGTTLKALMQLESAVNSYNKAIVLNPEDVRAFYNLGNALKAAKQLDAALTSYKKVILLKPQYAEAYSNRGIALQELKQLNAAVTNYDMAIALKPDFADAYYNLGTTLQSLKQLDAALTSYNNAIVLNPDYAEAYNNQGNILQESNYFEAALTSYYKAITLKPDFAEAFNNRGIAMHDLNRLVAALEFYDKAIVLKPDYTEAYSNRGIAKHDLNQLDAALTCYNKAVAIKPDYADAYWNKSLALLLAGDFVNGWEMYEWRWQRDAFSSPVRNFTQPLWLGRESLNGKTILLHSEQGFGDTIQFCRYAKLVAELGARVILEVPLVLIDLFKYLNGVAELIAKDEMLPAFDYHCPLLSLPLAFKTNLSNIPTAQAYLRSDPDKVNNWKIKLGDTTTKRIGLAWSGSITHKYDHNRSIALSQLLLHLPVHYEYISLQKELRENDKDTLQEYNIRHYGDQLKDFSDTAALCDLMDIVISVDTSVAHLAGALGKQTWILLPFSPDWRWLLDRSDSVWYPTVKLYRQHTVGNWDHAFNEVQSELIKSFGVLENRGYISKPKSAAKNNLQLIINEAVALHNDGQLTEALTIYENILKIQPTNCDALHLLGVIAYQTKQYQRAVDLTSKALEILPNSALFYSNRGIALQELGQLDAAVSNYDNAIALKPDYAEAYSNRGNALIILNQLEAAVSSYDKAVALKPDYADAYYNRGIALKELKQFDAAVASYDKAIALSPDYIDAFYNRGNSLKALENLDGAVDNYNKAISLKPDYAEVYNNRGTTLKELNQLEAAFECYDKAIALKPDYAEVFNNRGNALCDLNQTVAALIYYDKAIVLKPDFFDAYSNRGNALQELKQLDVAVACYNKAVAIKPDYADAYWNKSLALLLGGDFVNGWEMYEWRWKVVSFSSPNQNFSKPLWLGKESLNGKTILLHSEQGFGDTIQFCRYAKLVAKLGARVILGVPPLLLDLLKDLAGVAELVTKNVELPIFDYHCPLLSLPLAFKTNLSNMPTAQAYLKSDPDKVNNWKIKLGGKTTKRIGLAWSGSTTHKYDHNRSIALSQLLLHLPEHYEYISLQKELRENDKDTLQKYNIRHYGDELKDFTDTAALCDLMDIVISVDTSVAHLSAALGKQTWILLPFSPDWRWLLDRSDSVWYPTVKLYRQNAVGDWENAFNELTTDLLIMEDIPK